MAITKKNATTALVLGIVGLVLCFFIRTYYAANIQILTALFESTANKEYIIRLADMLYIAIALMLICLALCVTGLVLSTKKYSEENGLRIGSLVVGIVGTTLTGLVTLQFVALLIQLEVTLSNIGKILG